MDILSVILFLLAPAALGLGLVRLGSLARYNRRRRRRRPPDPLTLALFPLAAACLLAAMLVRPAPAPPAQTLPTETTPGTEAPTDPPFSGWLDGRYYLPDGSLATGRVDIDGRAWFFTSRGDPIQVVNPWHPVADDYAPELVALGEYYGSEGMRVDQSCLAALTEMIDACNASAGRAYVLSAYRSVEYQQTLYDRKVNSYLSQGYTRADAEREAATIVAAPGTSEHHLGLAVDIIDADLWALTEAQADMPAQKWLMENCWRYGFILRYPADKQAVTGVIYEPWHYRYVGKETAREIHQAGVTLEEYMDALTAPQGAS